MNLPGATLRTSLGRRARGLLLAVCGFNLLYIFGVVKYPLYTAAWTEGTDTLKVFIGTNATQRVCPLFPSTLRGKTEMELMDEPPTTEAIEGGCEPLGPGGSWSPRGCVSFQRLAVIIPFRDRPLHLRYLLAHLHPLLQRQHRHYRVFLAEQAYNDTFNKGRVMNVGFHEAMKYGDWDCVIFHDVDMIPENDHNLYMCGDQPRHLSPALDEMRYTLMYPSLVGGVLAVTPQHFRTANGFSNQYWGWGGEDDDFAKRLIASKYIISRPPFHIGRYKMVRHQKRKKAAHRMELLRTWVRYDHEGLNSIDKFNYIVVARTNRTLFTHLTIDVGPSPYS